MRKSLDELHREFMDECRYAARLSDGTLIGYVSSFELFRRLMPESLEPTEITPRTLTEFFRRLETRKRIVGRGKVKIGIKKTTVATYWSKLNVFMKWLEKKGHIPKNPFADLEFPYVYYDDRKFLKKEEVEKIVTAVGFGIEWDNAFVRKRNVAIFFLFLATGIRKSELLGLKTYDVDMERRQITVRAETSKSKKDRVIPLNSQVVPKLIDYIEERRRKEYRTPFFFASNNEDAAFTDHGLKHLVEKIRETSGVSFHVHQLRHTFAVNLINSGSDVSKVKQLMGHKDIRMTAAYLRCLPTTALRNDVETMTLDNLL